jgi:hypothetical protein
MFFALIFRHSSCQHLLIATAIARIAAEARLVARLTTLFCSGQKQIQLMTASTVHVTDLTPGSDDSRYFAVKAHI